MAALENLNCIDIVRPFIQAVAAEGMPPVQLMGGIGSVALLDEATVICADEKRIIAPPHLFLPNHREDGNLRDVDTLVLSASAEHRAQVAECAKRTIGKQLIPETFGFVDLARADVLTAQPMGAKALLSFLSDRYMPGGQAWTPDGPAPQRMLFPFSTPIESPALETWTLEVGDNFEIPVPSPGAVIINYLTRSISGLRHKDKAKVEKMAKAIFDKEPSTVDWIVDGPGSSQFTLARVFHGLRESKHSPRKLVIGEHLNIDPLKFDELSDHPAFMLREAPSKTQNQALRIAKLKSRGLHFAESLSLVVKPFQKYIEPRISAITHNK